MSQYHKLFDFQYARFPILAVNLQFGLFWSGGLLIVALRTFITFNFYIWQTPIIANTNTN